MPAAAPRPRTDGLLEYAVFEGWGNYDVPPIGKEKNGFSSCRLDRYDPRWIALHGIRYFMLVSDEGYDIPLTIPEDQWEALAEELPTEYLKMYVEETNWVTPDMMEQILAQIETLRGTSELTGDENAADDQTRSERRR